MVRDPKSGKPDSGVAESVEPWSSSLPMDDSDFRQIVEHFLGTLLDRIEEMEVEHSNRNFTRLVDLGHWLKGAGGTVGLDRFTEPGKQLETYAKDEDWENCNRTIRLVRQLNDAIDLDCTPTPSQG